MNNPSKIVNIFDVEFVEERKFSKESPYVLEAIKRLKAKRKFHEEEFEDVINLAELLLECREISKEHDKRNGNTNGKKKINVSNRI